MHIRMKSTQFGTVDRRHPREFAKDTEHDLTHTDGERELAQVFVREGWAVEVGTAAEAEFVKEKEDRERMFATIDARVAQEAADPKPVETTETTAPASPKAEKRKGK
jgi:hypothetical protein